MPTDVKKIFEKIHKKEMWEILVLCEKWYGVTKRGDWCRGVKKERKRERGDDEKENDIQRGFHMTG